MKSRVSVSLGLCACITLAACAPKKNLLKDAAAPAPSGAASQGEPGKQAALRHYVVRRGDSLWKIAGKQSVWGDAFQWPLLFKQNRDQIQDPDLIEVSQDLGYLKSYSKEEIGEARRLAFETPPYVQHSSPRSTLPLKY